MKIVHKPKLTFIIAMLLFVLFTCCKSKNTVEEIDIKQKLTSIKENQIFTLSQVNTSENWDSVLIIAPYNREGVDKLKTDKKTKSIIKNTAFANEGLCTLIFCKRKKALSYAFVSRDCIDFSQLNNLSIHRDEKLYIDTNKIVKRQDIYHNQQNFK